MFLAKTSSPNEWKVVASAISTLVEEASFEATAEGLTLRAMDPSHVALVDLDWPNSTFDKYDCDKQFKFTVRVEDLVKLIRRADAQDTLEISMAEEQTLLLKMENGYKREFQIHLIESTYGATPLPKLSFKSKIRMTEQTFEKMISDISVVSDHITIETDSKRLLFSGKSDSGTGSATLEKGNQDLLDFDVKEESKATYSIDYLLNITKTAGKSNDVLTFEYSSKMPLRLTFNLSEKGGRIHFYLAPRLEEK
ncbi:MAG: proliferating cell nuclear antigen (pcna) [Nitrososphaerales archaeon]